MSIVDNNDHEVIDGPILFHVTEVMKDAGIEEFFLEGKDFVIKFKEGGMRCFPFNARSQSVSEIMKKINKKLKKESFYDFLRGALSDIESQLIERREEIFIFSSKSVPLETNNETDEYRAKYSAQVTKRREHHAESQFPYTDWQASVAEKYNKLSSVVNKNFPESWQLLQFCIAVKSILNIDGCTLPFMGVILAIPSSMKTLVIQLFRKYLYSIYSDSFTPNSFESHNAALSEEQLRNVDLLPKLNNMLFLTPELAPVFTNNEDDLRKSLGIITRILDGHGLETDSGAQGHRRYGNTFFVWIGAAVEIPHRVWEVLGTLGHKIYFFRPEIPEKTIGDLQRIAKDDDFQEKFKETEESLLEYLMEVDSVPIGSSTRIDANGISKVKWNHKNDEEQSQAIACIAELANLLKRLRAPVYVSRSKTRVNRYNYGPYSAVNNDDTNDKKDQIKESAFLTFDELDYDTDYPIIEDASRAVVLLRNLALGSAISQGRDHISLDDIPLVINVTLSTTTRARSELIRLLFRHNGEITTSTVVNENKVSAPFAKKTMRELAAVGIVNISGVGQYNNSELKITLTEEYNWFKQGEFEKLFHNSDCKKDSTEKVTTCGTSTDLMNITATKEAYSKNNDQVYADTLVNTIVYNRDSQSHAETKSTPQTLIKSSDGCGSFKSNKISDYVTIDNNNDRSKNNSIQPFILESKNDRQPKGISSDNTKKYNNLTELEEKNNNSPLCRLISFQRVTQSHGPINGGTTTNQLKHNSTNERNEILKLMLEEIADTNGSMVSVGDSLQSLYNKNESVRKYIGNKLTQRENRKVRELFLDIIHNNEIELVKHKPQLIVRWIKCEKSVDNSGSVP